MHNLIKHPLFQNHRSEEQNYFLLSRCQDLENRYTNKEINKIDVKWQVDIFQTLQIDIE